MKNIEIGNYLKQKRKEKGKTQAEIAADMSVTFQAVSRWEKGDSIPDIDTLANLASYYQISIDEILQVDNRNVEIALTKAQIKKHNDKTFLMLLIGSIIGLSLFALFGILGIGYLIIATILSLIAFVISVMYFRKL